MVKSNKKSLEPLIKIVTLLAFVYFVGVLFIPIKTPINRYDEGFAIFGAARMLRGDLPYRDFWTIYPPGQFYALAFLFDRFGENLIVSRMYDTFVRLGIAVVVYFLARKLVSPAYALLACGITCSAPRKLDTPQTDI